jgi:hypothetical protein
MAHAGKGLMEGSTKMLELGILKTDQLGKLRFASKSNCTPALPLACKAGELTDEKITRHGNAK